MVGMSGLKRREKANSPREAWLMMHGDPRSRSQKYALAAWLDRHLSNQSESVCTMEG